MQLEGGVHPTEVSFMRYLAAAFLTSNVFDKRGLNVHVEYYNYMQTIKFVFVFYF